MLKFISRSLLILYIFACPHLVTSSLTNWHKTTAKIEIIKNDVSSLKIGDNTVLGILIKETNKPLRDLLEYDKKTLLSFSVEYIAPIKLKEDLQTKERIITQYGLYRNLSNKVQDFIEKNSNVDIRYISEDPISIQFIIDGHFIDTPVMVTDTIDNK